MNKLSEKAIKQMEEKKNKKRTLIELKVKERIWNNKKEHRERERERERDRDRER